MQNVLDALALLLSPQGIALALAGYLVGCFGGAMIGIGGALTTALVMPFTLAMAPEYAMIVLIGVYSGVSYAGSIPAILINTPGAPSSAASAFDGYPMARKGEATTAIAISATASAFGALIGGLALLAVLPILGRIALQFGSPEFLMFGVFGLASIVAASQAGLVKGFIAGLLGVLLATIGASLLDAHPRFTFGIAELYDGLDLVAMMIGIFAFSEMVRISWNRTAIASRIKVAGGWIKGIVWTLREWRALVRGSGIGMVVGLIPGEGGTVATFMSYVSEKQISSEPERFGKGHPAGIAGPEAANNAVIAGALVPTLSFGIPGSVSTAMLLTALGLQGIRPGPDLLNNHVSIVYCIVGSVLIGAVLTLGTGIMLSRPLAALTRIPIPILVPVVSIISVVGVYASGGSRAGVGLYGRTVAPNRFGLGNVGGLWIQRQLPNGRTIQLNTGGYYGGAYGANSYYGSGYGAGYGSGAFYGAGWYVSPAAVTNAIPASPSYANPAPIRAVEPQPAPLEAPQMPAGVSAAERADVENAFGWASTNVTAARGAVEEIRARLESIGQQPRAALDSGVVNAEAALKRAQDFMSAGQVEDARKEIQRADYVAKQVLKEFGR